MAVYVFSLLVGYNPSGVDSAQGLRNRYLKKKYNTVKHIFEKLPSEREIQLYSKMGISKSDMISVPLYLADNYILSGGCKLPEKLAELKNTLQFTEIIEEQDCIKLYRNGMHVASVLLCKNKELFYKIYFFDQGRLVISEHYGETLLYKDFYATVEGEGYRYAQKIRTSFVNKKGEHVYDCLYLSEGRELYVYPNGKTFTGQELQEKFIHKLSLSEDDIVIIDRPSFFDYVQPLFQSNTKAKIIVFFHSGHFYEPGEDPGAIYINNEYFGWFQYSNKIDMMIVSTEEQKKDLEDKLKEFRCAIPRIEAVPVNGLEKIRYTTDERRKKSLLTVSRLAPRKKIDWLIRSVIEAHKCIPEICLDIYGQGDDATEGYLKKLVKDNHAQEYIRFMGYCAIEEVYKEYEIYVTASLWETLGLSVMEAVGSGNAVIGLNVRYGNRLFVENNKNGKLIDFSPADGDNPEKVDDMIQEFTHAIIELLQDTEKLKAYQAHSYKIAERFLNDKIQDRWFEILNTIE